MADRRASRSGHPEHRIHPHRRHAPLARAPAEPEPGHSATSPSPARVPGPQLRPPLCLADDAPATLTTGASRFPRSCGQARLWIVAPRGGVQRSTIIDFVSSGASASRDRSPARALCALHEPHGGVLRSRPRRRGLSGPGYRLRRARGAGASSPGSGARARRRWRSGRSRPGRPRPPRRGGRGGAAGRRGWRGTGGSRPRSSSSTRASAAAGPSTSATATARFSATTGLGATARSWSYRAEDLAPVGGGRRRARRCAPR